jgi:DNA-binding response OmpR family regulator
MKKHILILEDNYEMKLFLSMYFSKHFNITITNNILDAITELEHNNSFDLFLTDLNLNQDAISGYDFIKYIKNSTLYKNKPIIVLSANNTSNYKIDAFQLGVNDYITKPFNPDELYHRINVALRYNN